jgi:superkiller protein 3
LKKATFVFIFTVGILSFFHTSCELASDPNEAMVSDTTLSLEVREWSKKIVANPKQADYYTQRAEVLASEKRFDLAVSDYETAISLDSDNPSIYHELGDIYFANDETSKALEYYKKAEEVSPNDVESIFKHAQFLYFVRQFDKSEIKFGKLLNLNPEHSKGTFFLAMLQKENGDTVKSISSFERVISLLGSDYNSSMQLALLHDKLGDNEQALIYYEKAINADPSSDEAYYSRGLHYQKMGDDDKAMRDYQHTIDLNATNYLAYYNAGNILAKLGNYTKAIDHFEICIRLKENYPKAYNRIGQCFELLGNTEKALENYKKCLQIDPNFALAKEGLERLS